MYYYYFSYCIFLYLYFILSCSDFLLITINLSLKKLLQTKISSTIIKLIANYIKGRKVYTTYRNHTSSQCQFKTGVPQGAPFHQHCSTFTLHTYYHSEHRFRPWSAHMTSPSHPHTQARVQPRNTYNHIYIYIYIFKVFALTKQSAHTKSRQNNLHSVHSRPFRNIRAIWTSN